MNEPGEGHRVDLDLDQSPGAPAQARRATRLVVRRWGLAPLLDSVVLTVSELVGNAVRYGAAPVRLTLCRLIDGIRVDVHDGSSRAPALPVAAESAAPDSESGRGLEIVSQVADEVGVEQIQDDGKSVYARFTQSSDS